MTLRDIVQSAHFRSLVAFLRIPLCYQEWKNAHPDVPIERLIEKIIHAPFDEGNQTLPESAALFADFISLSKVVETADPRLHVSFEALLWLKDVLDRYPSSSLAVLHMLLAATYTLPEMVTTAQLATLRQESEESWRQKAQAGKIPGAYIAGNRWLLPVGTLYVLGIVSSPLLKEALLAEMPSKRRKRKVRHAQEQTQE